LFTKLGVIYFNGDGINLDKKKAAYWIQNLMKMDMVRQKNIGMKENFGNMNKAIYMIKSKKIIRLFTAI